MLDGRETQKRARALLAYANIELRELAEQLGVSEDTMGRHAGKRSDYAKNPNIGFLATIAERAKVPMEFFYADFDRMAEIVPAGTMVIGPRVAPPEMPPLPGES